MVQGNPIVQKDLMEQKKKSSKVRGNPGTILKYTCEVNPPVMSLVLSVERSRHWRTELAFVQTNCIDVSKGRQSAGGRARCLEMFPSAKHPSKRPTVRPYLRWTNVGQT